MDRDEVAKTEIKTSVAAVQVVSSPTEVSDIQPRTTWYQDALGNMRRTMFTHNASFNTFLCIRNVEHSFVTDVGLWLPHFFSLRSMPGLLINHITNVRINVCILFYKPEELEYLPHINTILHRAHSDGALHPAWSHKHMQDSLCFTSKPVSRLKPLGLTISYKTILRL